MSNSLGDNENEWLPDETSTSSHVRSAWTPPLIRRLMAGEAELNPGPTGDSEGTS